ncbi:cysteine desulfurase family protein [Desulfobacterium sp. N47]|uniref:cysteine desulfurase n=1 Tax=uncultured Desulfobacterium sp. TaxID=201089 RepID=E1Y9Y6_9BACT|nr:Cysteine desulfurase [uncultured Desulfobacterium sp.]
MKLINLDYISANPLLPEVQEAMIGAIKKDYGNPSSTHSFGDGARDAIEKARESVAQLINSPSPENIIFTSSGTESINHAIKGVAFAHAKKGKHIVTSNIEHNSVLKSLRRLTKSGYTVTSVEVDKHGLVDPANVEKAITDETILISIMHANNEIGTIQPIKEIARIAKEKNVLFHSDCVASVGVIPIDVQDLGIDLISFAANQFNGPSGIGGLYIRKGVALWPLLDGGGQEYGRRAGTENLIGIIGMGVAADLAFSQRQSRLSYTKNLKNRLIAGLKENIEDVIINGHPELSLPNLVSLSVKYIEGESIVLMLDEENIMVSTRSACASGSLRASHVLLSIDLDYADAQGTLIITFGKDTTENEIDKFVEVLKKVVATLREMSPLIKKRKI